MSEPAPPRAHPPQGCARILGWALLALGGVTVLTGIWQFATSLPWIGTLGLSGAMLLIPALLPGALGVLLILGGGYLLRTPGEADPMRRFWGRLMAATGFLLATGSGLCTLALVGVGVAARLNSPTEYDVVIIVVSLVFGVPIVGVGLLLLFVGRRMLRKASR